MIGFTKMLCGSATVSDAIRHMAADAEVPPELLQFSAQNRPLVVWNTTRRCNLNCEHCYIDATPTAADEELTFEEAASFIDDLAAMKAPVLLFSGGEPLMREDLYELGFYADKKGLRPVISTNGTLIDKQTAIKIKGAGFKYVGVSIDGTPETHDRFRGKKGAFDQALRGIRACIAEGIKTGIRITVHAGNADDAGFIFDLVQKERIPRLCIYHLVYAGRGSQMMDMDTARGKKREMLQLIAERTIALHRSGVEAEVLTTDNHADGIWLYNYITAHQPARSSEVKELMSMHGGCSAGTKFANVDNRGFVHPCQFWQDYTIGNVRETPFSTLWLSDDPLLVKLRQKHLHVKGKCAACDYTRYCAGCRIRARAVYGDIWAEDPACYLTEEEITAQNAEKVS